MSDVQVSGQEEVTEPVTDPKPTTEAPVQEPAPPVEPEKPKQQRKPRKPKFEEPSIGRIVNYVTSRETIRPAIVTAVHGGVVDLTVFNSLGASPATEVQADPDDLLPHTWHWPTEN